MANIKSAKKRSRQNIVRRSRNRFHLSTLRTNIKKFRALVTAGEIDAARDALTGTYSAIDKGIQKGVIHHNKADRLKSRLTASIERAAKEA